MKPYFETENGKLYHGDCLDVMPLLKPVDLILTDIPYGKVNRESNGLRNLDKKDADIETFTLNIFIKECVKRLKGCIYIFSGTEQVSEIRKLFIKEGLSTRFGIWEKTNPSPMNGQYMWLSGIECFIYGRKKNGTHNVKCKNPVIRNVVARNQMHPTQKPTGVFQTLILASSTSGGTVLDPCFGSGTTAIVCENNEREWIGIEKSEEYCEISAKRIEQSIAQLTLPGF